MLEDLGIMAGLPNFKVIAPADAPETRRVIETIAYSEGPFYVRLSRESVPTILQDQDFKIGKAIILKDGSDIAIITTGITLGIAIDAANDLKYMGIDAAVIHMPTLKPIDSDTIIKYSKITGKFLTVEEHTIYNGLGSRVAEVLSEMAPARLIRIGINDTFGESGPGWELLEKYGVSKNSIISKAISLVGDKDENFS